MQYQNIQNRIIRQGEENETQGYRLMPIKICLQVPGVDKLWTIVYHEIAYREHLYTISVTDPLWHI